MSQIMPSLSLFVATYRWYCLIFQNINYFQKWRVKVVFQSHTFFSSSLLETKLTRKEQMEAVAILLMGWEAMSKSPQSSWWVDGGLIMVTTLLVLESLLYNICETMLRLPRKLDMTKMLWNDMNQLCYSYKLIIKELQFLPSKISVSYLTVDTAWLFKTAHVL